MNMSVLVDIRLLASPCYANFLFISFLLFFNFIMSNKPLQNKLSSQL